MIRISGRSSLMICSIPSLADQYFHPVILLCIVAFDDVPIEIKKALTEILLPHSKFTLLYMLGLRV